ncbi:MAG: hypothetical protein JW722_07695 [Demequinaceae bacterium]|nr:hypothetical protein [Demequinaceae bacterium]
MLELALAEGRNVSFEEYRDAHLAAIDCLEGFGVNVVEYNETRHGNWTEITYLYGGLEAAEMDALDSALIACQEDNVMLIDLAYQMTRASVDMDAILEHYRPLMIECVNEEGAGLPTDATLNEAIEADFALAETDPLREMCTVSTGLAEVQ